MNKNKPNLRPRGKLGSVSDEGNKNNETPDSDAGLNSDADLNQQIVCPLCLNVFSNEMLKIEDSFFEFLRTKKYKGVSWQCEGCIDKKQDANINFKQLICDLKTELKTELCIEIRKEIDNLNTTFQNKFNEMLSEGLNTNFNKHKEIITCELKTDLKTELCKEIRKEFDNANTTFQDKFNEMLPEGLNTNFNKHKEIINQRDLHDRQTKHTILVKPDTNDGEKFSAETWNQVVKQSIKPKLRNVPVTKSVITKNGKGVLFFPNQETRNEAAKHLKETCSIEVQDKSYKTILPKLKISSIPKQFFDKIDCSVIKNEILEKNSTLKQLVENEKKSLDIIFINDEKDDKYCYAVMKVDEEVKNIISAQGMKIYLGLSLCNVSERYHLFQCYACQNFGHRKDSDKCPFFKTNKNTCLYCSGEHTSKSCPVKKQKDKFKCSNCAASTDISISKNSTGHTTTDSNCPVLQQSLKMLMNRTVGATYRTDVPKNIICT